MQPERQSCIIHELKSEFGSDDERDLQSIDTIVVHSMYNSLSENPYDPVACKAILDQYEVSTHYLVDRTGQIWQLVPEERRAWHAGKSQMPLPDERAGVNSFSVGVELIGNETDGFTDIQYYSLISLMTDIAKRLPITSIVGHNDIAGTTVRPNDPKTDPWEFDWKKFRAILGNVVDLSRFKMIGPSDSSGKSS